MQSQIKTIELRSMAAERAADWKPEIVSGGFCWTLAQTMATKARHGSSSQTQMVRSFALVFRRMAFLEIQSWASQTSH